MIYLRPLDDLYRKSLFGVVLGALSLGSYSLYLTHQMNLTASKVVAEALIRLGVPDASELILRALYMGAFAAVFWVFCERPFMNRRLPAAGTAVAA